MAARKKKTASKSVAKKAARVVAKTVKRTGTVAEQVMDFSDGLAFRKWLKSNHASSPGIWVRFAKKGSGHSSITRAEAVDAALRWGWIDGQGKGIDAQHWMNRYTPRRARSIWSKINRQAAIALIAAGEMEAPGLAEVERAKADGRWDAAYDSAKTTTVPEDLAKALAKEPRAAKFFEKLNSANRYAVLWRIQTAKKPETRARRIEQFVAMLARGEKIHP